MECPGHSGTRYASHINFLVYETNQHIVSSIIIPRSILVFDALRCSREGRLYEFFDETFLAKWIMSSILFQHSLDNRNYVLKQTLSRTCI